MKNLLHHNRPFDDTEDYSDGPYYHSETYRKMVDRELDKKRANAMLNIAGKTLTATRYTLAVAIISLIIAIIAFLK